MTGTYKLLYLLGMENHPFVHWERNFVAHLVNLRELRGLTQTDVAKALAAEGLKFHQQTIQRIEAGERPVRLDEAFLIAKFFDVSMESMTGFSGTASRDEIVFAVDGLRSKAGELAEALREALNDWADDVDMFVVTIEDLEPTLNEDRPLVRWALEWATRFNEVTSHLLDTLNEAGWNAGESDEQRQVTVGSFELVRKWVESGIYTPSTDLSIDPGKLMAWIQDNRG